MEESEGKKEKSNKILNIDGPPSPEFQQLWEGIDVECHFRFPTSPPPWLDEKLYDAGIRFVNKNLVGVGMSNGEALVSGLCIPSFFNALTFSGETNAKRRALYRYRDTGMHIFVKWYQSKPWLPDSEAAASFKTVNAMHAHIANKIRAVGDEYRSILESKYEDPGEQEQIDVLHRDLENLREQVGELPSEYEKFVNNPIVFTQFDMGLVQSSFFGGPLLFPDWYGCSRASEADMAGFMHVWRVFGYYLGIEDRFNLAQFDVATTRALGFEYLDRVVKPCCLHVNKQSVFLGQKIFFEPSNYFVWIYRNYHMMGLELGNLWRSFSWQQTYWFYARYLFSYYFYPLLGVKQILNSMARRVMKTLLVKGKKK